MTSACLPKCSHVDPAFLLAFAMSGAHCFNTSRFQVSVAMILSSSSWDITYSFQQFSQPILSATFIRNVSLMAHFLSSDASKIWTEYILHIMLTACTFANLHWIDKELFNMENVLLPSLEFSVQPHPRRSVGMNSFATEQCSDISVCLVLTFLWALILHRGQQRLGILCQTVHDSLRENWSV